MLLTEFYFVMFRLAIIELKAPRTDLLPLVNTHVGLYAVLTTAAIIVPRPSRL